MALQFNHISKNALEELFEKDLTKSLHQYHNGIVKYTLSKQEVYNELVKNFIDKNGEDNYRLIDEMLNYNPGDIFNVVRNYLGISYSLGANQVLTEFKINKKHNLSHYEKIDVLAETEDVMNDIQMAYYDMMKSILIKNIGLKSSFASFINEIHTQFNKSKFKKRKTFIPNFPTIVNNVKIAVTSKMTTKGMSQVLKSMGKVRLMRYETQADEKVSSICRKWHGVTMPINQIEGIIPQHQNCRCRWIPDT